MPTILITGSNRGLGLEWTRQYAQLNWQVYATCRFPDDADDLLKLSRAHPNIEIHRLDVTQSDEIAMLTSALPNKPIDILLNNAGVYLERTTPSTLGHVNYSDWEETYKVNTLGPARVTEAFINHVAISDKKLVVATTSHMGSIAEIESPGSYAYRSSKTALNAVMKGISLELAQRNIGVLLLHPGWVRTRMGGPNGRIDANESVKGMREVVETFDLSKTGYFYRYDGSIIPW